MKMCAHSPEQHPYLTPYVYRALTTNQRSPYIISPFTSSPGRSEPRLPQLTLGTALSPRVTRSQELGIFFLLP